MTSSIEQFELELRQFFNSPNVYTFGRGRVALYVTLKAMKLQPGDEVLLPGYTCVMVPAAIQALGLKPVFVDIEPETYSPSPVQYKECVTDRTRVVILQHTYGIPYDTAAISAWAKQNGIAIIEDCCHAFGSSYNGVLSGTESDAAFFSGQWNKPFTTGLGGMLIVQDNSLNDQIQDVIITERHSPSWLKEIQHTIQILLYENLVTPKTTNWLTTMYRTFYEMGLIEGSSSPDEFSGRLPKEYVSSMSRPQARKGSAEMQRIQQNIAHRKQVANHYQERLPAAGFQPLQFDPRQNPVLLRYPLRVSNKEECLRAAFRNRIEIGSWFEHPLHPQVNAPEMFGYKEGMCPMSEQVCLEVINLPTHRKIMDSHIDEILHFLKEQAVLIQGKE